jgi:hypothetical protein
MSPCIKYFKDDFKKKGFVVGTKSGTDFPPMQPESERERECQEEKIDFPIPLVKKSLTPQQVACYKGIGVALR